MLLYIRSYLTAPQEGQRNGTDNGGEAVAAPLANVEAFEGILPDAIPAVSPFWLSYHICKLGLQNTRGNVCLIKMRSGKGQLGVCKDEKYVYLGYRQGVHIPGAYLYKEDIECKGDDSRASKWL